jgi:hypothetical protein
MDASAAAGGGAAALIAVLGIIFRTGLRMDHQARLNQLRQPPPSVPRPPATAPRPRPAPPRDPMLLTAAIREREHHDFDVHQAASAYLDGRLTDTEYGALRMRMPALYTPPPQPIEDAVPPEYRTEGRHP